MLELMERARAIVLVSHSAPTIRGLCNVAVWLHKGEVRDYGPADEVVRKYEEWQEARPSAGRAGEGAGHGAAL
jgi:ABC-type polysaccharide/polyol phosphate transport system ATPase subunit